MKAIKVFDSRQSLEKIFENTSIRRLRIGEVKICLAKKDEQYFAFELLCPHQKQPLDEGKINDFNEVICPLHFYRFNLNNGKEANGRCNDLISYFVDIKTDGVYINLH